MKLNKPDNSSVEHEYSSLKVPANLPVVSLSDSVVFPLMVFPMVVTDSVIKDAVDAALSSDNLVVLLAEKESTKEVDDNDLIGQYQQVGTVASIVRMHRMDDGRERIIIQGLARVAIESLHFENSDSLLIAAVHKLEDKPIRAPKSEIDAWNRNIRDLLDQAIALGKPISQDTMSLASTVDDPGRLADIAAATVDMDIEDSQKLLEELHPLNRLKKVHKVYITELQVVSMQQRISDSAKGEMEKNHKEFFLRQQIKAIQQELGDPADQDDEIITLYNRLVDAKMPPEAFEEAESQLQKMDRMHQDSSEAAVIRNYLDVIADLPWSKKTKDRLDLIQAKKILDEDHYKLDKVKDRILEHLGVMKLRNSKMKGPILCFVGPPGVGKTSLGRSIARTLKRKFQRLSLGGVRDEAEIRGHRRTYVGAMPGRIMQGLAQAKTCNPVYMMDEIDKIGSDFRGDPSSALLEVLDPEQNSAFRDNFLGVDFDLSNVMFILTANQLDPIPPAFRDRMEIIEIPGYTEEEKLVIAKKYLLPRQRRAAGITANRLQLSDDAILKIIKSYTVEAGVRNLEREIASVCRKVARKIAEGTKGKTVLDLDNIEQFLGPPKIIRDKMLQSPTIGVATGLAWTPSGGDVLFIESILMKGKGVLTLTGQLGEVMQESAKASLSYLKANAEKYDLQKSDFSKLDIHLHVPDGAIPKDGPSAGTSITTSLLSALSGRAVRNDIAMTGEITLTGRVLPVGGVKEKVLAARRVGIKDIILPRDNEKDLIEIQDELKADMKFNFVSHLDETLSLVFSD
jgi:ATP-dependent Lon protease